MTRTLTLKLTTNTANVRTAKSTKPVTAAQVVRVIVRKWDLAAVIALMASCGAYGVFALAHVA